MLDILLSVAFSVLLLVNFRLFPRFNISTFQAIALNYLVCFATGLLLMPQNQKFEVDFSQNWTWYCVLLGCGFILTFILSGTATQKIGMSLTSLANNVSLVIPVLFSLFVFGSSAKKFDLLNYLGLVLALLAVAIVSFKPNIDAENKSSFWSKGGLALAVFLMYGITNTSLNYLNIHYIPRPDLAIPVTLIILLGAIFSGMSILIFRIIKGPEKIELKNILAAITLGIPNFLSFYYLILALGHFGNSGAFVYPIYNIGVILGSTLISVLFFKEKISNANKIGLIVAVLAIIFISWQEIKMVF